MMKKTRLLASRLRTERQKEAKTLHFDLIGLGLGAKDAENNVKLYQNKAKKSKADATNAQKKLEKDKKRRFFGGKQQREPKKDEKNAGFGQSA